MQMRASLHNLASSDHAASTLHSPLWEFALIVRYRRVGCPPPAARHNLARRSQTSGLISFAILTIGSISPLLSGTCRFSRAA